MIIVGNVNNKEEADEIEFIAKLFVVGQRAQVLSQEAKHDNKTNVNKL